MTIPLKKIQMRHCEDLNITLNMDPFSDMCGTLNYYGAFFILDVDTDEDAYSI